MSEQSGRNESPEPSGSGRSGSERSGSERQRPATPAGDMLSDLQRWLLRSSARSMRKELSGQVRRTFGGGGQRTDAASVWDTATNEIPPEVGESPECQWCPICRAARRMRDSGPGIGGQLSGAGDAVASAVQDAISALDSILTRAGGDQRGAGSSQAGSPSRSGPASATQGRDHTDTRRDVSRPSSASGEAGNGLADAGPTGRGQSAGGSATGGESAGGGDAVGHEVGAADSHASVAGEHGPGGWKPGDRLATAHGIESDPWAGATEADGGDGGDGGDDGTGKRGEPGAGSDVSSLGPDEPQLDGQGHGPDDRG